jgi:hypothetical protein
MVEGEWLYRNGRYQTLNFAQARAQLEEAYAELAQRLRKNLAQGENNV